MEIACIDPPEPRGFECEYRRRRRPVVLRGLVPESAHRAWSFAAMGKEFADLRVPAILTRAGAVTPDPRRGVLTESRPMAELLDQMGGGGVPSLYMMARVDELPATWRERIATPAYCADAPWLSRKLWLSPAGTVTVLHRDLADNIHVQLLGSKRFTLIDARESPRLYPNRLFDGMPNGCRVDPEAPDYDRYPRFRGVPMARAELRPGDGIYIPRGMWHHVRALEDSLSVNFWWARGARLPLVAGADLFKRLRGIGR